jgi:hypothetical protein
MNQNTISYRVPSHHLKSEGDETRIGQNFEEEGRGQ